MFHHRFSAILGSYVNHSMLTTIALFETIELVLSDCPRAHLNRTKLHFIVFHALISVIFYRGKKLQSNFCRRQIVQINGEKSRNGRIWLTPSCITAVTYYVGSDDKKIGVGCMWSSAVRFYNNDSLKFLTQNKFYDYDSTTSM